MHEEGSTTRATARTYQVVGKWRASYRTYNEEEDIVCSLGKLRAGVLAHRVELTTLLDKKKGITFITPHQLSSDAKSLIRQGVDNFAQEVAGKGYWDGCRRIDQEVDLEIIIHIEKRNGESYLTVQRGKHRKVSLTKEKDLYRVFKFSPIGGIRDDIHGKDLSYLTLNAATKNGSDGDWWQEESKSEESNNETKPLEGDPSEDSIVDSLF